MLNSWHNQKVAFLGDSITDADHIGTTKNYWQFLQEDLQIIPWVYAQNGAKWQHLTPQIAQLIQEHDTDVDTIIIFAGTNDFNGNIPLGQWFTYDAKLVNVNGVQVMRQHRNWSFDADTLRGVINSTLQSLKEHFVTQQIVLVTPLHRAFAQFSSGNVQADENHANSLGLFVESYVEVIREAADLWACPLIDLFRESGLHPMTSSHSIYFHDAATDLLHPNICGHYRIAQTMEYKLSAICPTFAAIKNF